MLDGALRKKSSAFYNFGFIALAVCVCPWIRPQISFLRPPRPGRLAAPSARAIAPAADACRRPGQESRPLPRRADCRSGRPGGCRGLACALRQQSSHAAGLPARRWNGSYSGRRCSAARPCPPSRMRICWPTNTSCPTRSRQLAGCSQQARSWRAAIPTGGRCRPAIGGQHAPGHGDPQRVLCVADRGRLPRGQSALAGARRRGPAKHGSRAT